MRGAVTSRASRATVRRGHLAAVPQIPHLSSPRRSLPREFCLCHQILSQPEAWAVNTPAQAT